ncbi:MAG: hypothetical protein ABJB03_07550 [Rhodoglobus sp.]
MTRHLRWAIPLLLVPVAFFGATWGISALPDAGLGAALGRLALSLAALVLPAVALVVAFVGAVKVYGNWRRARGKYTKAEQGQVDRGIEATAAWNRASQLRRLLIGRGVPNQIHTWDVVAGEGEVFFQDARADYARFYGQNVSYSQGSAFFFGHPAFVMAGLGLSALGNAARRSVAEAQAQAQWREQQPCRLLVSNQRLLCQVGGRWLSFYYSAMTAVYPEVSDWVLIIQFETTEPLMLRGLDVPVAAVITTLMTHGPSSLAEHPSLKALGDIDEALSAQ